MSLAISRDDATSPHPRIRVRYADRCFGDVPRNVLRRSGLLFDRGGDGRDNRAHFLMTCETFPISYDPAPARRSEPRVMRPLMSSVAAALIAPAP